MVETAPHAVSFGSEAAQTFTGAGGNATIAAEFDPIANTDACKTVKAETETNTANYTMTSKGFTLLGLPTVKATIKATNLPMIPGQIDARLWDVTPGAEPTQRLITRGVYRLTDGQSGTITFQLHGNGWVFPAGDTVELQLLAATRPTSGEQRRIRSRSHKRDGVVADTLTKHRSGGSRLRRDPANAARGLGLDRGDEA